MSPVDFPESPRRSPAWLTEHFQSTGVINADNQVTTLEIKPVGDVIGVVGEVVRCHITYAEVCDAPASVVIKFAHRLPENRPLATTQECTSGKCCSLTRSPPNSIRLKPTATLRVSTPTRAATWSS